MCQRQSRLWIWLLHRLSKCQNTLPNSNLIWKAWACLNEFLRTPKSFVGKQITSTIITLPMPPCWLLILIVVLIHAAWSNNQESMYAVTLTFLSQRTYSSASDSVSPNLYLLILWHALNTSRFETFLFL